MDSNYMTAIITRFKVDIVDSLSTGLAKWGMLVTRDFKCGLGSSDTDWYWYWQGTKHPKMTSLPHPSLIFPHLSLPFWQNDFQFRSNSPSSPIPSVSSWSSTEAVAEWSANGCGRLGVKRSGPADDWFFICHCDLILLLCYQFTLSS